MKRDIFNGIFVLVFGFASQITQAQGNTYLSNLGQTSTGSLPVGSDSWLAIPFITGNNASGYFLNSVQLSLTDASGNPSDFTVMLNTVAYGNYASPGSSLGTLNGSLNPVTGGVYTYVTALSITLLPNRQYFIVLTAGTVVANGSYFLSYAGGLSYGQNGNWHAGNVAGGTLSISTDGSLWSDTLYPPQYAITATPVPEPSAWSLIAFSAGVLIHFRARIRHTA